MMIDLRKILKANEPKESVKETAKETQAQAYHEPQIKQATKISRLQEDKDDAHHSLQNTEIINNIYSQLIKFVFNPFLFYPLFLLVFICYVVADEKFLKIYDCVLVVYIAEKFLHFMGYFLLMLLSFSTAKGLRKLFREIILNISRKDK